MKVWLLVRGVAQRNSSGIVFVIVKVPGTVTRLGVNVRASSLSAVPASAPVLAVHVSVPKSGAERIIMSPERHTLDIGSSVALYGLAKFTVTLASPVQLWLPI